MFYDVFIELCNKKGVKPGRVAEECGINRSNVSLWKSRGYTPRSEALNKLAAYFGVSVDYLLGNEEKENPTTTEKNGLEDLLKDEFITFYGTIKSHLSEKDIEELTSLINTKVEINKRITIKKKTEKK